MKKLETLIYLVIGIAVMFTVSAKSYATGSVSGTVTDTSSDPVSNAAVGVRLNGEHKGSDITGADGAYAIFGLAAGTYEIDVSADGYENRIESDVVVTDGENTVKNITNLAIEGIITGKVTRSDGTTRVADVIITADNGSGFGATAITDGIGEYSIDRLPAGTYTIKGHRANYTFTESQGVEVTSGQTTSGVDLVGLSGKISGTVTESDGTTAIEGAFVTAKDPNGNIQAAYITDSSGDYELTGLATGSYTLTTWRNEGPIAEVSGVSVTDGQTTSRDLSAEGGSISGTVKNSSQTAIEGATLTAVKDDKMYKATSDASGNYKIEALPAGTYQLTVDPNGNDYVASKIDDVTVVSNQETPNQDFTLGPAGKITGTITNSSQEAIEGAFVLAMDPCNADEAYIPTTTDINGSYTVNCLRTGTYTIYVSADGYVSDSETDVSVTAGQTTSGKNFALDTSGGTISGTVYESDGQTSIENAMVQCVSEGKSWGSTLSDNTGHYSLTLFQAGVYTITAYAEGYVPETLDNIVVTVPYENSGNDFTLDEEQ